MTSHRLLIAGGGTGGHVLAGVALAKAWQQQFPQAQILFVGSRGGLEEKLVKDFPLKLLSLGSLNRVSLVKRFKTVLQLPLSLLRSCWILFSFRPEVVIGVGGYASGPVVFMAGLFFPFLRARTAILEQNAIPGLTNRILGRWVKKIFLAFPAEKTGFSPGKIEVTGNPIRQQIQPLGPATHTPFTLFIFGGSQGAMGINTLVLEALPYLKKMLGDKKIHIIHQTGPRDYARVAAKYQDLQIPNDQMTVEISEFIMEMEKAYQRASLLICRAGSSTLSEVAAVRRAAIFIPLPTAADDHQSKNAEIFARAKAAMIKLQHHCSGKDLADTLFDLINSPEQIRTMEKNVAQFYRPDAAARILKAMTG